MKILVIGSHVVPCGQTKEQTDGKMDGHEEASRFEPFCESV
jgi:hypothetical protein